MLTLKRNRGEWIIVTVPPSDQPRTIRIQLTDAASAKIGFEADKDVTINRLEVQERADVGK